MLPVSRLFIVALVLHHCEPICMSSKSFNSTLIKLYPTYHSNDKEYDQLKVRKIQVQLEKKDIEKD